MDRAELHFAARLGVFQETGPFTAQFDEFHDILGDLRALETRFSCRSGERLVQFFEILRRDMEAGQGVEQLVAGEVGKDVVEIAENGTDFEGVVDILDGVI